VSDSRVALARAAHAIFDDPTRELISIGVTGTNGKTTTTWIIDEALSALGARPALFGTVETRGPGIRYESEFTTPEADTIARLSRLMVNAGATHLVMEVSSHALALHRASEISWKVAAFTNLTQDHLDFHGTMSAYAETKARLFREGAPEQAVLRIDDPFGAELARRVGDKAITVSRTMGAAVFAKNYAIDRAGIRAEIATPWGPMELESALVGAHNLDNLLVAAGCLLAIGIAPEEVSRALATAKGAPGRLERVEASNDIAAFVDYAHSPDALANVLDALRPLTPGRLIAVFGCGGDRDREKRPKMGKEAASRADLVVITSDNPRTEDPQAIIDMIVPGVHGTGIRELTKPEMAEAKSGFIIEADRRGAITLAIEAARPGDSVLIAGKGHEPYQIVGKTKIAFDDRVEVRHAIERAGRSF
jgi:UDP-N-acetylmuramyl-tripeptide synthetase